MQFLRRIVFFVLLNALIVLTISGLLHLFHIRPFLNAYGLDTSALLIFCLIWGFSGALISLALSRKMALWVLRVQLITPSDASAEHTSLLKTVYALAKQAGLKTMPQVGVYTSPELNAFATGPTKNRALVAVSSGLLHRLSNRELEGVLAHEISHIANGDMITMTLLQGVVNAFVMFLARILAFALTSLGNRSENKRSEGSYLSFYLLTTLFEILFLLLGSMLICYYSRKREFRADNGGARLAGKDNMIAALEALQRTAPAEQPAESQHAAFQALKISTPRKGGLRLLFATHPPLEERIARLKSLILN